MKNLPEIVWLITELMWLGWTALKTEKFLQIKQKRQIVHW